MITHVSAGGFIHAHTDPSPKNKKHIRFNLLLSKPLFCDTIYNGIKIDCEECEYMICDTSKEHYTTIVMGNIPRICLSYGILV